MKHEFNPFMPGAGNTPPALVGREDIIEAARVLCIRTKTKRNSKQIIISGLRGVGKTALLNHLKSVSESLGCYTIKLEASLRRNILADIVLELRTFILSLNSANNHGKTLHKALSAVHKFSETIGKKCEILNGGF